MFLTILALVFSILFWLGFLGCIVTIQETNNQQEKEECVGQAIGCFIAAVSSTLYFLCCIDVISWDVFSLPGW